MRRIFMTLGLACLLMTPTLAVAQDATPVAMQATPSEDEAASLLFVQTASGSTLTPLQTPEGDATHELILHERSDRGIFFADRPSRLVGTIPNADLLELLMSEPDNPPNAALVAMNESGKEETIVLVLLSGEEDVDSGEMTYQVKILAEYDELNIDVLVEPVTEVLEERSYGETSLFIDDYIVCGIPISWCWVVPGDAPPD